jgi:hypothetical protein
MSLSAEQRQVLEFLAGSPRGCTKGRLLADGFTVDTLADLVGEGLATAQRGTLRVEVLTTRPHPNAPPSASDHCAER